MHSILLHVDNDDGFEARLQVALDLARSFDAHLTCLQPVSFDVAVPGDLYGTMIAELIPVLREAADTLRGQIEPRLENEGVRFDWAQEDGSAREHLLRHEALADLVVLGTHQPPAGTRAPSSLTGDIAVHGRAPLLVVPEDTRTLDVAGPVVVGWNGSPEAAHALRGAVPLLHRAVSVTLATVAEPLGGRGNDLPPLEGAEYLARHGIGCEIVELPAGDRGVAQTLADAAVARKAAMLVIGAYGHARAIETVFGGVTRTLFANPPLPLFTAH